MVLEPDQVEAEPHRDDGDKRQEAKSDLVERMGRREEMIKQYGANYTCKNGDNQMLSKITTNNNHENNKNSNSHSDSSINLAAISNAKLIRPTPYRYLILFLFCINSANKAFQWIQIPATTSKVSVFYEVSNFVINTTSVLFMLAFVVLSLPSCFIIELIGLRKAVLVASLAAFLGSLLKCFCCRQDSLDIYLLFAGQILVSLGEQFIFSVPSRLASVWFPDNQVSSAVAMTVLGNSLGIAFGFLLPPMALEGAETKDEIGQQMYLIFLVTTILSFTSFVADWCLFHEAPLYAPGEARLKQIQEEEQQARKLLLMTTCTSASNNNNIEEHQRPIQSSKWVIFKRDVGKLWDQVKELFKDNNYKLAAFSYGINVGAGYAISTILNQILEEYWPGDDILVGNCGFIIIVTGAIGSAFFGHILDKTHRYKLMNMFLTLGVVGSMIAFASAISILHSKTAVYLSSALVGLFQTSLIVSGLELAVEITYPQPELLTSSMMNVWPQIFGTIFIYISSFIVDNYGVVYTNSFLVICFFAAFCALCILKETPRRQNAANAAKHNNLNNNHILTASRDIHSTTRDNLSNFTPYSIGPIGGELKANNNNKSSYHLEKSAL